MLSQIHFQAPVGFLEQSSLLSRQEHRNADLALGHNLSHMGSTYGRKKLFVLKRSGGSESINIRREIMAETQKCSFHFYLESPLERNVELKMITVRK